MKPAHTGLEHIWFATVYSARGLRSAWCREWAFRHEVLLTILAVPLALWLGGDAAERALLTASVMLVLVVELLNSAVEAVVDRIGHEDHAESGRAKDLGSAAVMTSLTIAAVIWTIVLWPRLSGA